MTPRAEIWVPERVSKEKLESLLSLVDGRINKFQELKPIPVGEISPSSMVAYLKESHSSFSEFSPNPTYSAIFSKLRELPLVIKQCHVLGKCCKMPTI